MKCYFSFLLHRKDFINPNAFGDHIKSKKHKRRLHALKTEPYTIEESLRAAGMGSYHVAGKREMTTLLPSALKNNPQDTQNKIQMVLTGTTTNTQKKRKRDQETETPAKKAKVDQDGDEEM